MNLLSRLKGKDKLETAENCSILFVFLGAIVLSVGIGVNIVSAKGVSAIMAMLGALISFVSTAVLIAVWVIREFEKEVA